MRPGPTKYLMLHGSFLRDVRIRFTRAAGRFCGCRMGRLSVMCCVEWCAYVSQIPTWNCIANIGTSHIHTQELSQSSSSGPTSSSARPSISFRSLRFGPQYFHVASWTRCNFPPYILGLSIWIALRRYPNARIPLAKPKRTHDITHPSLALLGGGGLNVNN